jgi:predicted RNA binding protein YcfA (HicA-like mRNA interferase family)
MPTTVAEILKRLNREGWILITTRGSHRQYKHPVRPGRVTVAGKLSDEVAHGTLNCIRKQAGWRE